MFHRRSHDLHGQGIAVLSVARTAVPNQRHGLVPADEVGDSTLGREVLLPFPLGESTPDVRTMCKVRANPEAVSIMGPTQRHGRAAIQTRERPQLGGGWGYVLTGSIVRNRHPKTGRLDARWRRHGYRPGCSATVSTPRATADLMNRSTSAAAAVPRTVWHQ